MVWKTTWPLLPNILENSLNLHENHNLNLFCFICLCISLLLSPYHIVHLYILNSKSFSVNVTMNSRI